MRYMAFLILKKERHDEFTSSIKAQMYEWNDINDMRR